MASPAPFPVAALAAATLRPALLSALVLSGLAGPAAAEPAPYRVDGLAPGEPLSVRAEPDAAAPAVGAIRGRALVFGCTNDTPSRTTWCRVKAGGVLGWARRRYLAPE